MTLNKLYFLFLLHIYNYNSNISHHTNKTKKINKKKYYEAAVLTFDKKNIFQIIKNIILKNNMTMPDAEINLFINTHTNENKLFSKEKRKFFTIKKEPINIKLFYAIAQKIKEYEHLKQNPSPTIHKIINFNEDSE